MKETWIAPKQLFDGQAVSIGQAVRIDGDQVVEVAAASATAIHVEGCLTPGFVDLQVNGGGGVILNNSPTHEGIAAIAAAHRRFGTVAVMPTVITDAPEVLNQAADAIIAAYADEGVIGLHIEGPHISVAKRGTHKREFIRALDEETFNVVKRLRDRDIATMITVAPEAATPEQIAKLSQMGAVVSIGHTDASAEEIEAAIAAGAKCATHLFNAMSPMTARAPGAVGAIINSDIHSGIICDGHHVDDRMVAMALRARPAPGLTFLVSDAMATVGGPDAFELYGEMVRLSEGRLINSEGALAGAHVTQAEGVSRLVNHIGVPLQEALRMAISVPAKVVGKDALATLVGRHVSDLFLLSEDLTETRALADTFAFR